MNIAQNVIELIGHTPVVRLNKLISPQSAQVLVKLEFFNPGSSIKDRAALNMIEDAEEKGWLKPGGVIVEPTSGNTGIGLAVISAVKGYKLVVVMPDTMSLERRALLKAFGTEVILTPGEKGLQGSIDKANELVQKHHYFMPQQFENSANADAHRKTTAQEIIRQTEGKLAAFVAAVGTGGTLTGVSECLKEKIPGVKIIAVEPAGSPVLSGGQPGSHKIQGIGAGFVPSVLNTKIIDEIITVTDEDAAETARMLAREEGILAGISSGAAVFGALRVAKRLPPTESVLCIAPDTGERYLSSGLF